ncbi:FadR/GntR family transcriptional regulator [Sphingomonas sp. CJ20]
MNQITLVPFRPRQQGATARALGVAILSGEYPPGHVFLSETEQAAALGVSRNAWRDMMRTLAAKGLIDSRPKLGTRVTPREAWRLVDPEVIEWMFEAEPGEAFLRDLFEARDVIESAAAGFAARRCPQQHLDTMASALDEMRRHGLAHGSGLVAAQRFHRAVLDGAANEVLASLAGGIGAAVRWTTRHAHRRQRIPRDTVPDHVRVYDAIREGNPGAARNAMTDLLELALQDLGVCDMGTPNRAGAAPRPPAPATRLH